MPQASHRVSRSLALLLGLGVAAAGCKSSSPSATGTNTTPSSPDMSQKDPTKNASGTSSMGEKPAEMPSAKEGTPSSPDLSAKDPTKAPGVTAGAGAPSGMKATMGPDFKDATHVLTADQPFFSSEPADAAKPEGMWASGTPVLVLIPGAAFSKVKAGDGTEAYVSTAGLKPK